MDTKKISAASILAVLGTAVAFIANNPWAVQLIGSMVQRHPALATIGSILAGLGMLLHPQPVK